MSLEQIAHALALPADACSAPARSVLFVLAWYADADGARAWPSVATLVKQTGLVRRTVQTCLAELRELGLAVIEQPAVGQSSAVYRLILTRAVDAPLPAQDMHPRTSYTGAADAQGGRSTQHGPAQALRPGGARPAPNPSSNRHEPQNAGARTRVEARDPRGNGTGAPHAPPSNLHDNSPKFPLSPEAERTARAIRELAERKRMSAAKVAEPSDHAEPDPTGIPH